MSCSSSLSVSSRVCSLSVSRERVVLIDRRVLLALVDSAGGSADDIEIVGVDAVGGEGCVVDGRSTIVLDLRRLCREELLPTFTLTSSISSSPLWTGPRVSSLGWLPDGPAPGVDSNLPSSSISWLLPGATRQSPSARGGIFSFPRP